MTLTKQEAIENHRKMWNWIAYEIEKGNRPKYYSIAHMKNEYFLKHNSPIKNRPQSDCYCCEYARSFNPSHCGHCPLDWLNGEGLCAINNGLYTRVREAFIHANYTEAAKLARQIANLPEREDV